MGQATLARPKLLPQTRNGPRPKTQRVIPHLQVDQLPPAEIMDELIARCLQLPLVLAKQSRMASPRSIALSLPDECASGPADAFIDGHEFCHLHPLPEGGIHLTLPHGFGEEVVRTGWAEPHPVASLGALPSLYTLYAPRDHHELLIAVCVISQSCNFAQGLPVDSFSSRLSESR